jgi:hypothetical protein
MRAEDKASKKIELVTRKQDKKTKKGKGEKAKPIYVSNEDFADYQRFKRWQRDPNVVF